ncbi:MAG: hypothetical protein GY710_12100 [Desulfobacteraceae bacterium]|nr:hypothetical protein [Desulfobacteraceae bacterium]
MTDLFDDAMTADFVNAIRSVTDTFQKYPIVFGDGDDSIELLCGRKSIKNELLAQEEGESIEDAFEIKINRQYLAEKGLVDENDTLLIGYDTPVEMDGEQFTIIKLGEPAVFRDKKLNVVMEVIR